MKKRKLLRFLLFLILLDITLSFVYIMKDLKINIKILKPNLQIYINKNNYFLSSENSVVVEETMLGKEFTLDVILNGTNIVVLPISQVKNTPLNIKFDISFLIYINETNASNVLEVYFGRAYFKSCYNYTYIGKVETVDGTKLLCAFYKVRDQDPNSKFFGLIEYKVSDYNMDKTNLIILKFNPFIKGNWQVSLRTILKENFN